MAQRETRNEEEEERGIAVGRERRNVKGRERGDSDERKWENLGERKSRDVGQSQNMTQKNKTGRQENGTVEKGS